MQRTPDVERAFRIASRKDRAKERQTPENMARMAQIDQKADRITELAKRLIEGGFHRRVNKEAARLRDTQGLGLKRGPRPPIGANLPSIEAQAALNVNKRHNDRLNRIERIRENMVSDGRTVGAGRIADNRFGCQPIRQGDSR